MVRMVKCSMGRDTSLAPGLTVLGPLTIQKSANLGPWNQDPLSYSNGPEITAPCRLVYRIPTDAEGPSHVGPQVNRFSFGSLRRP
jgi:hypothetical protein